MDVSHNGIGLSGGASVASAISVNKSLTKLNMCGNRLGADYGSGDDSAVMHIANAVTFSNVSLREVRSQ